MANILTNFVAMKRTRGDVLNPQAYRSIIEMIRGILSRYNFSEFNEVYQSLLTHLEDHLDPHHVTEGGFYDEMVQKVYTIYQKMTPTPLSFADYETYIVKRPVFIELLRRIVLNHLVYKSVCNPDGSVPTTVTTYITSDWGRYRQPNSAITVSFNGPQANEDAFIRQGWQTNTTPVAIVFSAVDLVLEPKDRSVIFHTSSVSPYFTPDDNGSGYPFALGSASNDLTFQAQIVGSPSAKVAVFQAGNGVNTFTCSVSPDRSLEIKLNFTTLAASIPCNEGWFEITMTRQGAITVRTRHNAALSVTSYTSALSEMGPFTSVILSTPLENKFASTYGLRSFTVYRDLYTPPYDASHPVPMIATLPPSGVAAVVGSTGVDIQSATLAAAYGYNVYLTLSGTWTGEIRILRSIDNGANWAVTTGYGGNHTGVFTQNCDEIVARVFDTKSRYRLSIDISSGTVNYRLAQ